ncbi:hypothetical protein NQZ68_011891 [Dissostichus eleginoides]|nr:hypothetical protein NQZ68_011891 [Dissostichus eleginoides]
METRQLQLFPAPRCNELMIMIIWLSDDLQQRPKGPSEDSSCQGQQHELPTSCHDDVRLHINPLLCFVRVRFLATDNSHDTAPGQREPFALKQLALTNSSVQSCSYSRPWC